MVAPRPSFSRLRCATFKMYEAPPGSSFVEVTTVWLLVHDASLPRFLTELGCLVVPSEVGPYGLTAASV